MESTELTSSRIHLTAPAHTYPHLLCGTEDNKDFTEDVLSARGRSETEITRGSGRSETEITRGSGQQNLPT